MKKKIVALALVICMLAIAIVGGTLAYFTDTKTVENTFTTGDVKIELTEAVVETDAKGNLVAVDAKNQRDDATERDYGKLYPAQTVYKDPTIKNIGSESAYVAAKVTVTSEGDLHEILGAGTYDILALNEIISGGIEDETFTQKDWNGLFGNHGDTYFVYQEADKDNNTYVLYFFIEKALANNESVTLFEKISIPETWDNDQMEELKGLSIKVEAFATQKYGFDDCFTAITTAFPIAFPFAPANP